MRSQITGFTLVELMVTISVVGILAAIGMPSFVSFLANIRMTGEINALASSLNMARSEAMKRGQSVSVCAGSTSCTSTTSWTSGWVILLSDTPPTRLLVSPGVTHGDTLTSSDNTFPQFTPAGYTFYNRTLSLNDSSNSPNLTRCIIFNAGSWEVKQGGACP